MEKRALLAALSAPPRCSQHIVVLYQQSHTSCSESQKESLVLARKYVWGETRSRTQTDRWKYMAQE